MAAGKNKPAPGVIINSRVFYASRDEVFAAVREPARLAQWWGPKGFTNTFHEFDFQTGGKWRFTMRGPNGTAYEMDHQFTEIAPPERVIVRHFQPGHDFSLTITLVARGEGTELTWEMHFDDPAEAERIRAIVVPANEEIFDRLAAHLSAKHPVVR